MKTEVVEIIKNKYGQHIADELLYSYYEILEYHSTQNWKTASLVGGHFVEMILRIIQLELKGTHTPLGKALPKFDDSLLKSFENSKGNESYRILIPRIAKGIYDIRNKRGVGHKGLINPNRIDTNYILYSSKWILAELIRLNSTLKVNETEALIEKAISVSSPLIWEKNGLIRILKEGINIKHKILIILYFNKVTDFNTIIESLEYKNGPRLMNYIKSLHSERFIEVTSKDIIEVTPKGVMYIEDIIRKLH